MGQGSFIESLGVYIPEKRVSTASIEDHLRISRPLKLEVLTGINERRECSGGEDSVKLAEGAVTDCLKYSRVSPDDIEMIIYCGISKYRVGLTYVYEPDISLLIKQKFGNLHAITFDISNACAGMLTGIHVGSDFIERGVVKNCLVVSGEYITNLCRNAMQNIKTALSSEVASLTIGDAGGALMLCKTDSEEERIHISRFATLGTYSDLCIGYQSRKQAGGIMETQMKKIHEASMKHAPAIVEAALTEAGISMGQIDYLIPHQTSKLAIREGYKHFSAHFGEIRGEVVINLEKYGNTASTSHVLALYGLLTEKQIKKGDTIMMIAFASGLVIGVTIFTMGKISDRYGN